MPTPTTPPAARRTAPQWLDLIAGLILTLIGAMVALTMLGLIGQLTGVSALCQGVAADGTRCNGGFLTGVVILGDAIVVFAWALGFAWLIVRAVRRKLVFWIPLVSGVVIIVAFYLAALLLGAGYQPAA